MKIEENMKHYEDEDKQRKLKIKRENRLRLNKFYFNDAVQDSFKPTRDTSQRNEDE